jgi:Lysine methyltransferase
MDLYFSELKPHLKRPGINEETLGNVFEFYLEDGCCLKIESSSESELKDVGIQLWSASLLMADFILNCPTIFDQEYVLELGCGVGLVASLLASSNRTILRTLILSKDARKL